MLVDTHGRRLNYLRLAVTDRCNLRCSYCMPMQGLDWIPRKDLLTYEEIIELSEIFAELGVEKIRFTGGEPTLRRDFDEFTRYMHDRQLFKSMHLTTNATKALDNSVDWTPSIWSSVNISLDSLDRAKYAEITGRDQWMDVMKNIDWMMQKQVKLRINAVVMNGKNDGEIIDFANWTMSQPIDVRFIEEMPFNGHQKNMPLVWSANRILERLRTVFELTPEPSEHGETAMYYKAPRMKGRIGIIAAFSRSFCGSCNRLRITPQGVLRTCLYSEGGLQLRDALRQKWSKDQIVEQIKAAVMGKPKDGFAAEQLRENEASESMAMIGG